MGDIMNSIDFTEKIIMKEKYFNSSVIALIVEASDQKYFLFEKRAQHIRQGGDISFPGGRCEKGETSLDAALRETYEELGISHDKILVMGKIGTNIIPSGVLVEAFLGVIQVDTLKDIKVNTSEVEEYFLVPLDFFKNTPPRIEKLEVETRPYYDIDGIPYEFPARELNLPKMYHSPWRSPPREVFFYIYEKWVIWGITADIIVESLKYF